MGIGGALNMPATLSILTSSFADPSERARAIGIWAGVAGIGVALGPIAGGYLLDHFAWSSVFWVNVPLIVVALVAGRAVLPASKANEHRPLDPIGALLSVAALTALVYSVIEAPQHGWTSGPSLVTFAVAAVLGTSFVSWEIRHPHPMLDVRFFANPRFSAASTAITLAFFALAGALFLITQHLQFVLGYSPLEAGVGILPAALALFIAGPVSAHLSEHIGVRSTVTLALSIAAAGLALQAAVTDGSSYLPIGMGQALFGLGLGLAMAPATDAIMGSLPVDRAGVGSAVNDTTREVGQALGVAVIGSIAGSVYTGDVSASIGSLGLPAPVVAAASDNVGAAHHVAGSLDPTTAARVLDAANGAFVDALHAGLWVAAAIAAAGAAVALLRLPARDRPATAAADPLDPQHPTDRDHDHDPDLDPDHDHERNAA
jgi:EmrB/QacA subfamily drug resistance transporter